MTSADELLPLARVRAGDQRFLSLLHETLARIPHGTKAVRTVEVVALEAEGGLEGLVGLTHWREGDGPSSASQTLTFYSGLFNRLSDAAAVAVIAHELAHAWLNEHYGPEQSRGREREADRLARGWGFGRELDRLDREAESIDGSAY